MKVTITEKESARYEFGNEFIPVREPREGPARVRFVIRCGLSAKWFH